MTARAPSQDRQPRVPPTRMVGVGVSLALIGCALGVVGALGAGRPLALIGWATFVVGWVIAAVAVVKAGYRLGRGH